ncbi:hypothetical protein [Paenibacillus mucilaginosus]|uniref:Lipoprotein n=2 Tax=Paenibacillus mucilaginosus TaxID=61624 RepID=H6NTB3_9BACL|nr:hypothetical protein [Paenibacillus mucilaginosus]AEI39294.1 hypothetical protein KNP414_00704 [Paenibacillus mucilaginosus KNP414]AFC27575.1 hypothetical protein PM3016_609 [Paenibacillus mucilaginosus 3016]MCG7216998.1 hypothetical protein [Paenibacillus mucilaginosus]WDM28293.1 hypothetical protein KCX80_03355 [Paenibacillus mucilaginosus]WFA16467.1 hypothetical protein ERY13_03355 [Paenibacillus mucilaginosus]
MTKRTHRTFTLALVLAGAAVLAAGCTGDSVTIPTPDGGKAVISGDKEVSTITTDQGKVTLSSENQLPEGFPKDIPIPGKAAIQASMKSEGKEGGEVYTVAYEIEQPFEETKSGVESFFKSSGYTESTRLTDEAIFLIAGKKEGLSLHFTVSKDMESDRTTNVTIVHEVNK